MRITKEMTKELNAILANMGCIFNFEYRDGTLGNSEIEIRPVNGKFIQRSIINPTKEFYEFLENYFKSKGIEELSYNNTGSIIWSTSRWKSE